MSNYDYLQIGSGTDDGQVRDHNEDSLTVVHAHGVYCVADGMGGAQAGEVASRMVVEAVERELKAHPDQVGYDNLQAKRILCRGAVMQANRSIREYVDERHLSNSGSTVVILIFDFSQPGRGYALHAGDSRLYRLRGGSIDQLTKDHSLLAESDLTDESQLNPMFRGIVTRAVGMEGRIKVEETALQVEAGDVYLLCSDGLSNMVDDPGIRTIISEAPDLETAATRLIDAANEAGGRDNITAVLVGVSEELDTAAPGGELKMAEIDVFEETGSDHHTEDTFGAVSETSETNPSRTYFSTEADLEDLQVPKEEFSHSNTITVEMETVEVDAPGLSLSKILLIAGVLAALLAAGAGLMHMLGGPEAPPPEKPDAPEVPVKPPVDKPGSGVPDLPGSGVPDLSGSTAIPGAEPAPEPDPEPAPKPPRPPSPGDDGS